MSTPDTDHTAPEPIGTPVETIALSYGPRDDPFQATLTAAAGDAAVTIPLTPLVLAELLNDLHSVDQDQRNLLGLPPRQADETTTEIQDQPEDPDRDQHNRGTVLRRASDPLGLRQLKQRPRTTLILAAVIAISLLVALIVQVIQR